MPYTDTPPPDAVVPLTADDGTIPGNSESQVMNAVIGEVFATQDVIDGGTGDAANFDPIHDRVLALEAALAAIVPAAFSTLTDNDQSQTITPLPRGTGWRADGAGGITPITTDVLDDATKRGLWIGGTGGTSPISITTQSLPAGTKSSAYTKTLNATGGSLPRVWTLTSGWDASGDSTHPIAGITLTSNSDGTATLAGTPSAFNVAMTLVVRATDAAGWYSESTFLLSIVNTGATALAFAFPTTRTITVGPAFDLDLSQYVTGGTGPYTYHYTNGPNKNIHDDITPGHLKSTGVTGTAGQTFTMTVSVTDSAGSPATVTKSSTVTLAASTTLAVTTTSLPAGTQGVAYTAPLAATGGTAPYVWSIKSGVPVAPLAISGATLAGTPTSFGTPSLVFTVTDALNATADSASMVLSIAATSSPLAFDLPMSFSFTPGQAVSIDLATYVTGGTGPYTYADTSLPVHNLTRSGSVITSGTGGISGTNGQTFTLHASVTDSAGSPATVSDSSTVSITAAPTGTNLATYSSNGIVFGDRTAAGYAGKTDAQIRTIAANNRALINTAMAAADVYYSANDPGGTPYSATNMQTVLTSGTVNVKHNPSLVNLWIKRNDYEPLPTVGESAATVSISGLGSPFAVLRINGNGAKQYWSDPTRTTGAKHGHYSNGLYVFECGSSDGTPSLSGATATVGGGTINGFRGDIIVKNTRGVTGSSAKAGTPGQLVGSSTTVHERATECFDMVIHGCFGGDLFAYQAYWDDGPYDTNAEGDTTNSGPKWHYTQLNGNNGVSPWSVASGTTSDRRHGPGTYGGGRVWWISGSSTNDKHDFNFEGGDDAAIAASQYNAVKSGANNQHGPGVAVTRAVRIGDPTLTDYDQVISTSGGIGFQVAGSGTNPFPDGIDLYGFSSHGDGTIFNITGNAPGHFKVWGGKADAPRFVHNLGSAAIANVFFVAANGGNASLRHLGTGAEASGHAEVGGQVSWTTYAGG